MQCGFLCRFYLADCPLRGSKTAAPAPNERSHDSDSDAAGVRHKDDAVVSDWFRLDVCACSSVAKTIFLQQTPWRFRFANDFHAWFPGRKRPGGFDNRSVGGFGNMVVSPTVPYRQVAHLVVGGFLVRNLVVLSVAGHSREGHGFDHKSVGHFSLYGCGFQNAISPAGSDWLEMSQTPVLVQEVLPQECAIFQFRDCSADIQFGYRRLQ